MKPSTDLTYSITKQALRAVAHGDQAWIQAHLAVTAFLETGRVPRIGKYRFRNLVFYRIRNRQYARRQVIPLDPRTPAQQRTRAIMRLLSPVWRRLTPEQRQSWIAAGEKVLSRLRLTQGPLAGEVLFIKLNFVLCLVGREPLLWPPQPAVFGRNPVEELMIRREHGRMRLKLKVSGPVVEDIMVYGEGPVSAGRKKLRHPVYLGLLPAARNGWSDITEQYEGRFGALAAGKKVLICTRQQREGWKDAAKVSGAVVPMGEGRRKNAECRKGKGVELRALPGLRAGLRDCRGLELNELLGLPGVRELPGFRPRRGEAGWRSEPDEAGWGSCWELLQLGRVAPCTWEGFRPPAGPPRDRHAWLPGGELAPGVAEGGRKKEEGRMQNPEGVAQDPAARGLAGKRRKCHRRALWRGT